MNSTTGHSTQGGGAGHSAQNLAAAQQLATATLAQMMGVDRDPTPMCTVETLGDSNVALRVFGWVDQTKAEFGSVRSEAIRLVKGAFDRAGVVMPEPIYNVHVDRLPEKPAVARPEATRAPRRAKAAASTEPQSAIDVEPREDLAGQIEDARGPEDEDLLHPQAARE